MDKSYIVADMNMSRPVGWTTEDEVDLLLEAGMDGDASDMVFYGVKVGGVDTGMKIPIPKTVQNKNGKPCWSAGLLFDMLPKIVTGDDGFEYHLVVTKTIVVYSKDKTTKFLGGNLLAFFSKECLVANLVAAHLRLFEMKKENKN